MSGSKSAIRQSRSLLDSDSTPEINIIVCELSHQIKNFLIIEIERQIYYFMSEIVSFLFRAQMYNDIFHGVIGNCCNCVWRMVTPNPLLRRNWEVLFVLVDKNRRTGAYFVIFFVSNETYTGPPWCLFQIRYQLQFHLPNKRKSRITEAIIEIITKEETH